MLQKASSGLPNEFAIEKLLKLNRGTMKIVQDSTIKRHIPNWLLFESNKMFKFDNILVFRQQRVSGLLGLDISSRNLWPAS
jgi:hypothetical protein